MPDQGGASRAPARRERVMVFIDGSNLYHVLTENCGRHDLVFSKFVSKLIDGRDLERTYYYNVRQNASVNPQASAEQEKFLSSLFETPYLEVRLGVHRRQGGGMVEKGVDVMMATDLVVAAYRDLYDTAIVVSGDGDFYPAVQAAKDVGKHVEVVAFQSNLSPEVRRVADLSLMLTKSFFTGLWTDRRRTKTEETTETSGEESSGRRPATRRRRSKAKSEQSPSSREHRPDETAAPDPSSGRPADAEVDGPRPASDGGSAGPSTGTSRDSARSSRRRPSTGRSRPGPGPDRPGSSRGSGMETSERDRDSAQAESRRKEERGPSETQPSPGRRRLVSVTGARGSGGEASDSAQVADPSTVESRSRSADSASAEPGRESRQESSGPKEKDEPRRLVGWLRRRRTRRDGGPPASSGDGSGRVGKDASANGGS